MSPSPRRAFLLAAALVLLALNLRTTVASLPPLLTEIEADLRLPGWASGLLTSMPMLCMAWFAPSSHWVAQRFGKEVTAFGAIVLVAAGNGIRGIDHNVLVLFSGMFLAGLGVAVAGVVLPGIVKDFFPRSSGAATGAYSVAMMLGAAAAATFAVPLRGGLGTWQASLASWALPAVLASVFWLAVTARTNQREPEGEARTGRLPWRSPVAWLLATFFAVQASLGYAYLGWLAPAHEALGWTPEAAGVLLGAFQLAQLATALFLPALADRTIHRRPALLGVVVCSVAGAAWLWVLPGVLPWAASFLLGAGLGGGFALSLVLIVDYAATSAASSRLAAMVFLVGYTTAAIAPVLVGALRDSTGGFAVPFGVLTVLAVVQLAMATQLGSKHHGSQH